MNKEKLMDAIGKIAVVLSEIDGKVHSLTKEALTYAFKEDFEPINALREALSGRFQPVFTRWICQGIPCSPFYWAIKANTFGISSSKIEEITKENPPANGVDAKEWILGLMRGHLGMNPDWRATIKTKVSNKKALMTADDKQEALTKYAKRLGIEPKFNAPTANGSIITPENVQLVVSELLAADAATRETAVQMVLSFLKTVKKAA